MANPGSDEVFLPTTETERKLFELLTMLLGGERATKGLLQSRTIIAAGFAIFAGLAMVLGITPDLALQDLTAEQVEQIIGTIFTIVGSIFGLLRLDTETVVGR